MNDRIGIALWFNDNVREAMEFYADVFPESSINHSNEVVTGGYLSGVHFTGINGGPVFKINPSVSMMVICETESEIDRIWNRLAENGSVLMSLGAYPWSARYGWLADCYGVNWQLYFGKLQDTHGQKIVPTLMFGQEQFGNCSAALDYYAGIFKDFKLDGILRYSEKGLEDNVQHAQFQANDFLFMAMDGPDQQTTFNEGVSFVILCDTQAEIDAYWNAFTAQGKESMCGWCKDAYGVSWQVIPRNLGELLQKYPGAGAALMKMKKIDIAGLQR